MLCVCCCSSACRTSSIITIAALFFGLFASVSCQQQEADRDARILESENVVDQRGYHYRYTTSNGIHRSETGVYHATPGGKVLRVNGFYQYLLNGKTYGVSYRANENGYQTRRFDNLSDLDRIWDVAPGIDATTRGQIRAKTVQQGSTDDMIDTRIGTPVIATLIGGGIG